LERSGTSARLTLELTRFPDDSSADFRTLVTFQRKTHFTFHRRHVHRRNAHRRNCGAELSHSGSAMVAAREESYNLRNIALKLIRPFMTKTLALQYSCSGLGLNRQRSRRLYEITA